MQTHIDLPCFDGVYTFKLGLAQISEIEKKCDAGIGRIYAHTLAGRFGMGEHDALPSEADFRFSELIEIVRQGLIGGKHAVVDGVDVLVSSARANELLANYVLDGPNRIAMRQTWAFAAAILSALIEGYDPGPNVEPAAEPATPTSGSTTVRRSRTARK